MAAGALTVLATAGRRVPEDVAVVGYDDSPIAATMTPRLTSVRQPIEEMGREMARLLIGCRGGVGPRASARDPRHRPGTARIERREALALSRPATGGRDPDGSRPYPTRPH